MDVGAVEAILRERLGLDPGSVGSELVAGAVRRRLRALGLGPDAASYPGRLRGSPEELQALVDEVVTTETWFFRDVEPFRRLAALAAEVVRSRPGGPPFRVLSAPCATGEEAYSIAIALIEAGLTPEEFRVDGLDVSRRALEAARAALYTANAFRTADLGFRDRYFRPEGRGFRLDPAVARLVRFEARNLLDPDPPGGPPAPSYDAIFCRNLLIYLDGPARQRLLANVDRWLAPDGLLFVGHADPCGLLESRFRADGAGAAFAYRRRAGGPPPRPASGPPAIPVPTRPPAPPAARMDPSRPAPSRPAPAVAPEGREAPRPATPAPANPAPSLLERAEELANRGSHAEAADACERWLRERGPSAAAYVQLGMIRQAQGQLAAAEAALEKALYLDPRHEEALLALALLARRRGDGARAERLRRRAERAFREGQSG